ncbi:unnamed protein product [Didymodactylos carnosus]|uniref:Uncharacterized protein n=1 Tax=Didymodactylos carnosus TaxID=1234261 RepID=A0A814WKG7_9BILA|nr:unnamed protein product [Didymodactylos carnosus]CAF1203703.1 unnamed protein product [Didymodactylos carnosus]CAF3570124.1 unnamed protein product [Didymodactylos carnosus]CAF3968081.1 unnamed protein product [Didymodactylos carnosus]
MQDFVYFSLFLDAIKYTLDLSDQITKNSRFIKSLHNARSQLRRDIKRDWFKKQQQQDSENEEVQEHQTQDYEENYSDHEAEQKNIGSNQGVVDDQEFDTDSSYSEEDQQN